MTGPVGRRAGAWQERARRMALGSGRLSASERRRWNRPKERFGSGVTEEALGNCGSA